MTQPLSSSPSKYCVQAKEKNPEALIVEEPHTLEDENGSVRVAKIRTYGDVTHTLIDRANFSAGFHLPGYKMAKDQKNYRVDPVSTAL